MAENSFAHRAYWNSFYGTAASSAVPAEPSSFARWVATTVETTHIAEFGCGNARDSLWFARQGLTVMGYDFADSAVTAAANAAFSQGLKAEFSVLDLYDARATDEVAKNMWAAHTETLIYGRFLIHALEDTGRANFFDLAAAALADGGSLCLEFRTGKDRDTTHLFGEDHYRQYLDPSTVEDEISERGGHVTYSEADHGLALYKTEDPHVARIVAAWQTGT